jgi:hypothetical protein
MVTLVQIKLFVYHFLTLALSVKLHFMEFALLVLLVIIVQEGVILATLQLLTLSCVVLVKYLMEEQQHVFGMEQVFVQLEVI